MDFFLQQVSVLWKPVLEIGIFWFAYYLLFVYIKDSGMIQALKGIDQLRTSLRYTEKRPRGVKCPGAAVETWMTRRTLPFSTSRSTWREMSISSPRCRLPNGAGACARPSAAHVLAETTPSRPSRTCPRCS